MPKLFIFNMLSMESDLLDFERSNDWGNSFPRNGEAFAAKDYDHFCGIDNKLVGIKSISCETLLEMLADKTSFQLIDVREPGELPHQNDWTDLKIPLHTISDNLELLAEDKPVILFCRSGIRSKKAIEKIVQIKTMDNLYSLEGGIMSLISVKTHANE